MSYATSYCELTKYMANRDSHKRKHYNKFRDDSYLFVSQ